MKKIIITLLFFIGGQGWVTAQILGGFFSQQSTKAKIMAQQIAAYETYLHYLKSGYDISQNGLNTLHELKNGTFTLHENYFNSLGKVTPSVRNNPKIKGISDLLNQIEITFDKAISWQKDKSLLSPDEITYMQNIYSSLLQDCNKDLDELSLVVTDGKTQMEDAQRMSKIDQLYTYMQQKYSFSRSFCDKAYQLANGRNADQTDKQALKKLYDLN